MSCLRCGRDTAENQVFCQLCLEEMKKYPVKPGTAVQLPVHPEHTEARKVKPKQPTPEERFQKLRRAHRTLQIILVMVLILYGLTLGIVLAQRNQGQSTSVPPVQNFGTPQTTTIS